MRKKQTCIPNASIPDQKDVVISKRASIGPKRKVTSLHERLKISMERLYLGEKLVQLTKWSRRQGFHQRVNSVNESPDRNLKSTSRLLDDSHIDHACPASPKTQQELQSQGTYKRKTRMKIWKRGNFSDLCDEAKVIQSRLTKKKWEKGTLVEPSRL